MELVAVSEVETLGRRASGDVVGSAVAVLRSRKKTGVSVKASIVCGVCGIGRPAFKSLFLVTGFVYMTVGVFQFGMRIGGPLI